MSKSTGFIIQLMTLCSALCANGKEQIPGIFMLHQLIDCLNDVDISTADSAFLTALLDHPLYIDDAKIMLFIADKLIKVKNNTKDFCQFAVNNKQDFLFVQSVADCLNQKKFTSDNSGPVIQLMALYAQSCSEIAPEFSIKMMIHAIELLPVDNLSNCRNVFWDTLLTNPIYLQDTRVASLVKSKFISTKLVAANTSGSRPEDELKLQFLLNVINGLASDDQKKFMLANNHFFVRFVEWCTRKGTPARIISQVQTLYAEYLKLPELEGAINSIQEQNGDPRLVDGLVNDEYGKPMDAGRCFVFCQQEGDVSYLLLSRKEICNMFSADKNSELNSLM